MIRIYAQLQFSWLFRSENLMFPIFCYKTQVWESVSSFLHSNQNYRAIMHRSAVQSLEDLIIHLPFKGWLSQTIVPQENAFNTKPAMFIIGLASYNTGLIPKTAVANRNSCASTIMTFPKFCLPTLCPMQFFTISPTCKRSMCRVEREWE